MHGLLLCLFNSELTCGYNLGGDCLSLGIIIGVQFQKRAAIKQKPVVISRVTHTELLNCICIGTSVLLLHSAITGIIQLQCAHLLLQKGTMRRLLTVRLSVVRGPVHQPASMRNRHLPALDTLQDNSLRENYHRGCKHLMRRGNTLR